MYQFEFQSGKVISGIVVKNSLPRINKLLTDFSVSLHYFIVQLRQSNQQLMLKKFIIPYSVLDIDHIFNFNFNFDFNIHYYYLKKISKHDKCHFLGAKATVILP